MMGWVSHPNTEFFIEKIIHLSTQEVGVVTSKKMRERERERRKLRLKISCRVTYAGLFFHLWQLAKLHACRALAIAFRNPSCVCLLFRNRRIPQTNQLLFTLFLIIYSSILLFPILLYVTNATSKTKQGRKRVSSPLSF